MWWLYPILPVLIATGVATIMLTPFAETDEKRIIKTIINVNSVFLIVFVIGSYFTLPTITPVAIITWAGFVLLADIVAINPEFDFVGSKLHKRLIIGVFSISILLILSFPVAYISHAYDGHVIAEKVLQPSEANLSSFKNLSYGDIQFTVIPYETAIRRMNSALSQYGIIYRVSDADYQLINGSVYWVGSVTYGDFWKWFSNGRHSKGIPFVVILKATENDEAKVIQLKEPMRYTLGNYFGNNVERLLWERFPSYRRTVPVLQIHEGKAYYVSMLLKPTRGSFYTRFEPYKLALIDAGSGKINLYDPDKAPDWITFVHQEDEVEDYLHDYFKYVHGLLNSILGQRDVLLPTGEIKVDTSSHEAKMSGSDVWMLFIKDHPYWYSALRPPSSKYSMYGLALIDAVSGKMVVIKTPGYYNDLAGVQNILQSPSVAKTNTLKPTQPIPIIIGGKFAWLSPVISNNKELQFFSVVDASNGKVFIGDTVEEVIKRWLSGSENINEVEVKPANGESNATGVAGEYIVIIKYNNGTVKKIPVSLNTTIVVEKDNSTILTYHTGG